MTRAVLFRPPSVRYSNDLPSAVMLQLLPRVHVVQGRSADAAHARPWRLPELG